MPIRIDGTGYIGSANNIYTDGSGNVGLGTTTPTTKLEVNVAGVNGIHLNNPTAVDSPRLLFTGSGGPGTSCVLVNANGDFRFGTGGTVNSSSGTERMRIDSSGRVTMPYQPRFSGYRSAGNVSSGNVFIANQAEINVGNCYNTSTGIFTAPVAGDYFVSIFGLSDDSTPAGFQVLKNNTLQLGFWPYQGSNLGNGSNPCAMGLVSLSSGDNIKVNCSNGLMIGSSNFHNRLTIYLVG
jgi:hypothetical protein